MKCSKEWLEKEVNKIVKGDYDLSFVDIRSLNWPPPEEDASQAWHEKNNPDYHVKRAKWAIVLAIPYDLYLTKRKMGFGRLASIGRPVDYHVEISSYLMQLEERMKEELGDFSCKKFVDKDGFDDRKVAYGAGLGFWGKHHLLIHEVFGSAFNIGYLLTDLEILAPNPVQKASRCGSCLKCINGCPTSALLKNSPLNTNLCRAALNQKKGPLSHEQMDLISDWVYGCDICQWLCPYNRSRYLKEDLLLDLNAMMTETKSSFKETHKFRAYGYLGTSKLKRNAMILLTRQAGIKSLEAHEKTMNAIPMLKEQYQLLKEWKPK